MKCEQIQEMMGPYLYGDLSLNEMNEVRTHLEKCLRCREDLESREQVLVHVKDNTSILNIEDRKRISRPVRSAVRQDIGHCPQKLRFIPAFAAALLIIAAVVAGSLIIANNQNQPPSRQPSATIKLKQPDAIVTIRENSNNTTKALINIQKNKWAHSRRRSGSFGRFAEQANKNTAKFADNIATSHNGISQDDNTNITPPGQPAEEVTPDKDNSIQTKQESGTGNGSIKLPKPSDINDATTLPKQQEQTNDTN